MGINGLWKIMSSHGKPISLGTHSVETKVQTGRFLTLGVDMSVLMAECTAATLAAGVNGQFHGGALKILFSKLGNFLKCPVIFVFVYDGPQRPLIKRNHSVINHTAMWWTEPSQILIGSFGYHVHQAPGEAEAELAMLSCASLIDGVITSDSDTIIFGANFIYKTIPTHKRLFEDEIELYNIGEICTEMHITRGGLILFALLSGGDYDTAGVKGIGPAHAIALAKCGFGDQLIDAQGLDIHDYNQFLRQWLEELHYELAHNPRGLLPHASRNIAENIPETFPNRHIILLYLDPVSSHPAILPAPWVYRQPSILNITKFASDHLGWTREATLREKCRNNLWEGIFLQMVFSPLTMYDPTRRLFIAPNTQAKVLNATEKVRKGKYALKYSTIPQPRLSIDTTHFTSCISGNFGPSNEGINVWVPKDLLPGGILPWDPANTLKLALRRPKPKRKTQPGIGSSLSNLKVSSSSTPSTSSTSGLRLKHILDGTNLAVLTGVGDTSLLLPNAGGSAGLDRRTEDHVENLEIIDLTHSD